MNPALIWGAHDPGEVEAAAQEAIELVAPGGEVILGPGCALGADTPADNIHALIQAAHKDGVYNTDGTLKRPYWFQDEDIIMHPDPSNEAVQKAFQDGALKQFERHSRLGFINEESFVREIEYLRGLGAKRVTLKTGAYPMRELAMALRWSSDVGIDLLTIDGAPGGTGMSPWRMMVEWGIPTVYLEAMTYELCQALEKQGAYIPSIAIGGGMSAEDHIFKAIALGAPYVKGVCLGRAIMIPGMVGKHIGEWLESGNLPRTVSQFGSTVEERFVTYETLKGRRVVVGRGTGAGRVGALGAAGGGWGCGGPVGWAGRDGGAGRHLERLPRDQRSGHAGGSGRAGGRLPIA